MKTTILSMLLTAAVLVKLPAAESPFDPVATQVHTRSGETATWLTGSAEDQAAQKAVDQLLQHALTANSAAQIALLNNRHLQATLENLGLSQADLVQAGLLKNPVFTASWRVPDRPPSLVDAEYSVAQDFLDVLMIPLRKRVAEKSLLAAQQEAAQAVLDLAAETKTAFYQWQADQQIAQVLQKNAEADDTALTLAQLQKKAGNITDLQLAAQSIASAESQLAISRADSATRSDREALNRRLGVWGSNTDWKAEPELPDVPASLPALDHLETRAISQRLDLAALRTQLALAAKALALKTKTRFLPASIELGLDTERDSDRTNFTGPTLQLELPIFDHGQGAVARLAAEYRRAEQNLWALAVDIRSQAREARDQLIAAHDTARYYHDTLLPQRKALLKQMKTQYNAMLAGTYDLLQARQGELASERAAIESGRDYWLARVALESAVGGKLTGPLADPTFTSATAVPTK
ncbi:MAG: TolC family protein [Chthoniobacteraceae bacterium]